MTFLRTGTDRKARAAIYRNAAQLMERTPHHFACCGAIRTFTLDGLPPPRDEPEINAFAAIYKPEDLRMGSWWFGIVSDFYPENNDDRVLALCFMAAMVEAGDA